MKLLRPLTKDNTLLLVIDVQKDFCSKEGIFGKRGNFSRVEGTIDNIIKAISTLEKKGFETIYFKQLYNPESMPKLKEDLTRRRGTPSCNINSDGHEFYRIDPKESKVFIKYCYDSFANQGFCDYLETRNIESIIVTGFDTHICVETSIRSGFNKGYQMVLLTDCVGSRAGKKRHNYSIETMSTYFAVPINSRTLYKLVNLDPRKQRNFYNNKNLRKRSTLENYFDKI